ncbi:MAG TPA: SDR family oxidoreductase [Opitutaceae bacterium]|nr:SDR family oxidoreductase [Opitutaceae bacterium]
MPKPLIVVTGASQGIGAAIARAFAKELRGSRLALIARSEGNLRRVAKACERAGAGMARAFPCDVSDAAAVARTAKAILGELGVPDVLVNNAGSFQPATFLETSVETFDELIAANLRSTFLVSKQFVPAMVKRRHGHVFNMSSIAGLDAYPNSSAYCAAKFGVVGLSKVMREELKPHGVRVTVVCPGATVSPSWSNSGVEPSRMIPTKDAARVFVDAFKLSERTVVEEIVLRPQLGDL